METAYMFLLLFVGVFGWGIALGFFARKIIKATWRQVLIWFGIGSGISIYVGILALRNTPTINEYYFTKKDHLVGDFYELFLWSPAVLTGFTILYLLIKDPSSEQSETEKTEQNAAEQPATAPQSKSK